MRLRACEHAIAICQLYESASMRSDQQRFRSGLCNGQANMSGEPTAIIGVGGASPFHLTAACSKSPSVL